MLKVDKANHRPKDKNENTPGVDLSRRRIIAGTLAGGALLGLGLAKMLWRDKPDTPPMPDQGGEIARNQESFEKWSSVELPKIELDPNSESWGEQKLKDYLVPEKIDEKKLNEFFKRFDEELIRLKSVPNQNVQIALMLVSLVDAFRQTIGSGRAEKGEILYEDLNKFLLLHGYNLELQMTDGKTGFIVTRVKKNRPLNIHFKGGKSTIPLFETENDKKKSVIPKDFLNITSALFHSEGDYVTFNIEDFEVTKKNLYRYYCDNLRLYSTNPPPSEEDFYHALRSSTIQHEGMHAYFKKVLGLIKNKTPYKLLQPVNMGHYDLDLSDITITVTMEAELAGLGFGLMNSGPAVHIEALELITTDIESYTLAQEVLLQEIMNSKALSKSSKKLIDNPGKVSNADLGWKMVMGLNAEELHKIGERMVKLAIHLSKSSEAKAI